MYSVIALPGEYNIPHHTRCMPYNTITCTRGICKPFNFTLYVYAIQILCSNLSSIKIFLIKKVQPQYIQMWSTADVHAIIASTLSYRNSHIILIRFI